MKRSRYIFLLFQLLLSYVLTAQDLSKQSLILKKELVENANAIVRLDDMTVELLALDKMVVTHRRIVTVLNSKGNRFVHARAGYDNSLRVNKLEATIYDNSGKEVKKIKKRDFKDESAVGGGTLYSDSRVLYLDYTPVSYPYTIEVYSEIETPNTSFIPTWYFLDGYNVSTEVSKYSIRYDPSITGIRHKERFFEDFGVKFAKEDGLLSFEVENIQALRSEDYSPSFSEIAPNVQIVPDKFHYEGFDGEVKNWQELGKWMYDKLLAGRQELPDNTIQEIRSLVEGVEDTLQRAKLVYEYMQKRTRYISVQVGIGGIQPISAMEVDKTKYGDCKGLSNYTSALLKAAGVNSYYTHVEANHDYPVSFEGDFASIEQGNHVILAIPYQNKLHWIDCTSQVHPFGFLGDFTDHRQVLIMKPDGGEIVETSVWLNEDNSTFTHGDYSIDAEGNIKAKVILSHKGLNYNDYFLKPKNSREENIKYYKDYWHNVNNITVSDFAFKDDRDKLEFTEEVGLQALSYGSVSGSRLIFKPNAFNDRLAVPDRYRDRRNPVEFDRGFLDTDEFIIGLPEGFEIEAMPEGVVIDCKFGKYSMSLSDNGDGTLTYKRTFLIREGKYSKEEYEPFRNFLKESAKQDNAKLVLIQKDL